MGAKEVFNNAKGSGAIAFTLAIILWIIDFSGTPMSFTGLIVLKDSNFYSNLLLGFISAMWPLIAGMAVFMLLTNGYKDKRQIGYVVGFSTMIAFFGYVGGYRTILHIIFPMLIIGSLPESEIAKDDRIKTLIGWYLLDFLTPGIASAFLPKEFALVFGNSLVIPYWVIFASMHAYNLSNNGFYYLILGIIVFMSALNFMSSLNVYNLSQNNINEVRQGFFNVAAKSWETVTNMFNQATNSFTQLFNQSYYDGTPEQTEKPQGLYLKEMDRGDIDFRTDYPVYLWARLEANTLDQEIEASVICYTEVEDDFGTRIIKGIVDEDSKSTEMRLSVINGVERSIPCIFENLPEGSYDVYYNATFTFSTEARKKIYMMNRDRLLSDLDLLHNKGKDPKIEDVLSELYDITDTDPTSIYTTGPIQLAIGTDKVPWDIGERNNIKPLFGVTVSNMWHTGGKIAHIDNLYLKIPDSFSFTSLERSCTFPITETSEQSELGYRIYKVANTKELSDVKDYVTINCHMTIDQARSLDPLPVTTRSLKTRVDYTYLMQEEISIDVNPGFLSDDAQEIIARSRSCCEITTGSEKQYQIVDTEGQCSNNQGDGSSAKIVDSEFCQNG
ncbi:MAG: hypothetical protein ABIJ34_05305 [archaeon]